MLERLSAAILEQRERLAGLPIPAGTHAPSPKHIDTVLDQAQQCRDEWRLLVGWRAVHEARLEMIGLYPPEDRLAYRIALRQEAREALTGTRLSAAEELLAEHPRGAREAATKRALSQLRMVRQIIDGHWQGVYMRAIHTRTQLFYLPIVLAGVLLVLLAISLKRPHPLPELRGNLLGNTGLLMWVYACGALGALLSVTLGTIRGVTRQNYLLVSEARVNITRPLLGAASAAAVVAILNTSLFNLGASGHDDRRLILAAALAAGFSERLLTSALAAVVHGAEKK
jgi:hypothetical protein